MLDVGAEDDVHEDWVGLSWLDEAADQLELPDVLDPLADSLQRLDVLEELVGLRWCEREVDLVLLASSGRALWIVALEVLVSGLQKERINI